MGLLALTGAHATPLTPDEQGWLNAVSVFTPDAKAAGMTLEVERETAPKSGSSPVAAEYRSGKCVIILSARGNPASVLVQQLVMGPSAPAVARVASVAHEFGHCAHLHALNKGQGNLPAAFSPDAEALADAYALAWFASNSPSNFGTALAFFRKLRADASSKYAASRDAVERMAGAQATDQPLAVAADALKD